MTLYPGSRGDDVKYLQTRLNAHGANLDTDGIFGVLTKDAVMKFQGRMGIAQDGIAGPVTLGLLGNTDTAVNSVDTSPPFPPMSAKRREEVFGKFAWRKGQGDSIVITDGWAQRNIVKTHIPQLDGVPFYYPDNKQVCNGDIYLHVKAAPIFKEFFSLIDQTGLRHLIRTFDGAFVARLVRGSETALSNHAWGTAIDINCYANPLGKKPAPRGVDGSVIELVPLAHSCGLYWGGNFSRPDGMHFEVAVVAK